MSNMKNVTYLKGQTKTINFLSNLTLFVILIFQQLKFQLKFLTTKVNFNIIFYIK